MKKKTSSLKPTVAIPAAQTKPFGQTFIIKGESLLPGPSLLDDVKAVPKPFKSQQELSKFVMTNRAALFGEQSIGLNPNRTATASYPWDAILFEFSNPAKPECYLIKTATESKDFLEFILSMTALFAFVGDSERRRDLVGNIGHRMNEDKLLKKKLITHFGTEFSATDLVEKTFFKKPQVLLLTDDIQAIPLGFASAYPQTWGDMLKCIHLQKYQVGKTMILTMNPPLADLKEKPKVAISKERVVHTEADHLAKASDLSRSIYEKLKADILKIDKSVIFNAKGKHYISVKKSSGKNSAFFHYRKNGIYLVVMLEEKIVRKMVKKAEIKSLPESVQKFWNGASTGLLITSTDQLKEITEVFKKLIKG